MQFRLSIVYYQSGHHTLERWLFKLYATFPRLVPIFVTDNFTYYYMLPHWRLTTFVGFFDLALPLMWSQFLLHFIWSPTRNWKVATVWYDDARWAHLTRIKYLELAIWATDPESVLQFANKKQSTSVQRQTPADENISL